MTEWVVDASHGGGQLVRTALCLAALQGRPLRLTGIRAGRSRPGLQRQHLAGVKAIAEATAGSLSGAQLGSLELSFTPGDAAGPLDLNVIIGTAGSTMLVLQALLPLLARRGGRVRVSGGTDNPLAPPVDYYRAVFLPALREVGVDVTLELLRRGYYPKGGGQVVAESAGQDGWGGFERVEWLGPVRLGGVAYSSRLPLHVTERLRQAAVRTWRHGEPVPTAMRPALRACEVEIALRPDEDADSPGAGIVLWAEDEAGRRVSASALGEPGKPSEKVAGEAATALLEELSRGAPCDRHLGDQLAFWAALATSPSRWRVGQVTEHLETSLHLLGQATGAQWAVVDGVVVVNP